MKTKVSLFLVLFLSVLFFQNCGKDLSVLSDDSSSVERGESPSPLDTNKKDIKINDAQIVSARYWRGGWFGMHPNWSYDMDFIFNEDDTITVKSKSTDMFCFKVDAVLDSEQRNKWEAIYSSLEVKPVPVDAPIMVDSGSETLVVVFSDNSTKTIHLAQLDAQPGDLVAANGYAMSDFLKAIDLSLIHGCQ